MCAQCTYLQEQEEDCLQTSYSDTPQLSLWNGNPTPAKSCEKEPQTDGSQDCTCGKGTLDCSTHPSTPEKWIAYMQDSLARILASPENRQALARKRAVASTEKSSASLAWFDPATCSLRTSQQSLLTDSEPYSPTLPRSGMTRNGYVYELPTVGRITRETDGGYSLPTPTVAMEAPNKNANTKGPKNLVEVAQGKWNHFWPTPTSQLAKHGAATDWEKANRPKHLHVMVSIMWPTPTAHNAKECAAPSESERNTPTLAAQAGGKLNPTWVCWLMGFPLVWFNGVKK